MERGVHQVVAIYAAVKTGAAYVPLDPELPDARLAHMLEDSAPGHLLTDRACDDDADARRCPARNASRGTGIRGCRG